MNREEFLRQLESFLQDVSPAEREEAIQYYNDYFDDAGPEKEMEVIKSLGTPYRVAENIKKDLGLDTRGAGQTITTVTQSAGENTGSVGTSSYTGASAQADTSEKKMSNGMIVLIVILCVIGSPIILSAASGILGVLFGLIVTWFVLIAAFGVLAVVFLILMFILIAGGIAMIAVDGLIATAIIGVGLMTGGFGLLFLMLTVAMAGIATPAMCRGVASLFRKIKDK